VLFSCRTDTCRPKGRGDELLHRNVQRFRAGSYLRPIDFVHHSTLGLSVMQKKSAGVTRPAGTSRSCTALATRSTWTAARCTPATTPQVWTKSTISDRRVSGWKRRICLYQKGMIRIQNLNSVVSKFKIRIWSKREGWR